MKKSRKNEENLEKTLSGKIRKVKKRKKGTLWKGETKINMNKVKNWRNTDPWNKENMFKLQESSSDML